MSESLMMAGKRMSGLMGLCLLLLAVPFMGYAADTPAQGDLFPGETLVVPGEDARTYLGLKQDTGTFSIADIDAELVLVEIFSMYCPYCQKEAPEVNRLHDLIRDRGLGERIKIIGIAPGNSDYEVGVFRSKFSIEFPLCPDADFVWHKCVGEVGTPYFFVVENKDGGSRVLYSEVGGFGSAEEFLGKVLEMGNLH